MRAVICAIAFSAAVYAGSIGGSGELNLVRTRPRGASTPVIHQVIVKLRDETSAAGTSAVSGRDRIVRVVARSGLTMRNARQIYDRLHVVKVEPRASADPLSLTVERIKADLDVEYAVADERRYIHAVPDDPLYAGGGQWYEKADPSTPAAVNAQGAWDLTTGDPNLVIADLDTGVRFDHPDLLTAANNGRLLPGYDFISNVAVANDGDGREADASDPGDWINTSDKSSSEFKDCDVQISSWHGTRTAGILGALSNNLHGISGMTWQGKILPARVLGKCGGYDSDIIAAMLWAAGLPVSGVPGNTHPARIINMSLGSQGSCPQAYSDTIAQLTARGILVVVSAGNEGGEVDSPANCPGVVSVAGLRHAGTKVGYSSLGREVTVSAPAGNCGNSAGTCVYSIQTTTNSGAAGPVANDDAYTGNQITTPDQPLGPNLGTSFSAPIVSGIAALMASVNSNLNTCQLISRLREGSLPFPQTSADAVTQPPSCHVPSSSTDLQTTECICTLDGQTCGAGMANALGAVTAALRPIAAIGLPSAVSAGQSVTLDGGGSAAANGHTISNYQWSSVGKQSIAIQNGTSAKAAVTAPSCGLRTVQLTVTDEVGRMDAATVILSPSSAISNAPVNAKDTSCQAANTRVMVAVCSASDSVQTGGTDSFTVTVANTADDSVSWQVNGVPGGNSIYGTISASGVYTAPAKVPSSGSTVTITGISNADPAVKSSVDITLSSPATSGGGGAVDPLTLVFGALLLLSPRYLRRSAASSQLFCARR